jgi:hypothetical protein
MAKSNFMTLALIAAMSVSHVAAQKPAPALRVTIDVKPGDNPTSLEPKREGMVPIAVLSSKDFDATAADLGSIRAGATGTEGSMFRSMKEDVDHDGDVDLIILFRVADLALTCSAKGITVKGKTGQGRDFEGTETVTMTGC